ncbi:MAG: SCP2 sterol-binding domain-containing protein [Ardenticatenaceae bacterium]|nr:SCP2 sterol-binding domain-containing protein [Ardenticatenaceae bacterium]
MKLEEHPSVIQYRATQIVPGSDDPHEPLDASWLRRLCLEAGADDVGFVEIDRPALDNQRDDILYVYPKAKTLISFVMRMHQEPIRSPARSVANHEFHHTGDQTNEVARDIVKKLTELGIGALNPPMAFPMEMDRYPGKSWIISHKPVAVAAGLGHMGIHRNVIHPKFGNFILLGTILIDREVSRVDYPVDFNPCLECKLCVAACPVGAVKSDGRFDFAACYTHNYREFMGGFTDWVEQIAESKNAAEYQDKFKQSETASMWQSLSFGANYKAAYCLAVCPAGEDVIGPYLDDRRGHLNTIVKPLQKKEEPVYVVKGSDAETHVAKRFPHKQIRHVRSTLRADSIASFLQNMGLAFQPGKAAGLNAVYHFTFLGEEQVQATISINDQKLKVSPGHQGTADLHVQADSRTWLKVIGGEEHIGWALIKRQIRLKGQFKLLLEFGKCFPN